ncbi:MAG: hypothetical protein BAJATHORv1_30414 [Candidatus Thorarchaeota archaeon]|nr:MAG: hypothetical protein BAJATHORv1_30414 [Candidatus Thorarchaeota archaeon]
MDISEDAIRISTRLVGIIYNIRLGTFDYSSPAGKTKYFSKAKIMVHTETEVYDSSKLTYRSFSSLDFEDEKRSGRAVVLRLHDPTKPLELNIRFSFLKNFSGFTVIAQIRNKGEEEIRIQSIEPLFVSVRESSQIYTGSNGSELMFLRQGFQSWDLTQASQVEEGENISHFYSVLTNKNTNKALILGFATHAQHLTEVRFYGRESIENRLAQIIATSLADNVVLQKHETMVSEELVCIATEIPQEGLDEYINLTARRMDAIKWKETPVGWCSWYFYYTMPDENEIMNNAQFLKEYFAKKIDWIQLDDGYQKTVGDWTENDRFKQGLDKLAGRIHQKGYKAGLWVAPFIATQHSTIFKENPDWFLRDSDDNPIPVDENPLWLGKYYAFDLSNPTVIKHIQETFSRLKSYGFEYWKIDFLYYATKRGKQYDPNMTRAKAFRDGMKAIRDSVGDDLILGCGAPIGPCIGFTNMMRIGTDIAPTWRYDWGGGVYEASINTITRAHQHNKFWINDPDCILVRQEDNELSLDEVLMWVSVVALSGGAVILSDRMEDVAPERLTLIDKILPPYHMSALALDALVEPEPRVFYLPITTPIGDWVILAVLNLSEKEIDVSVKFDDIGLSEENPQHIFDFWNKEYEGLWEISVEVDKLPPHSHKLLLIKPESNIPSILSTSMHYTQGAIELKDMRWNPASRELEVTVTRDEKDKESIFIVFGKKWSPKSAYIGKERVRFNQIAPEVISVEGKFKRGTTVKVAFTEN